MSTTPQDEAVFTICRVAFKWVADWYDTPEDRALNRRAYSSDILVDYGDVWDVRDALEALGFDVHERPAKVPA